MKITIDTGTDSKEEIRKVIDFLKRFVDEYDSAGAAPTPSGASQGMMSMFDADGVPGETESLKDDETEDTTDDDDDAEPSKPERVEVY